MLLIELKNHAEMPENQLQTILPTPGKWSNLVQALKRDADTLCLLSRRAKRRPSET